MGFHYSFCQKQLQNVEEGSEALTCCDVTHSVLTLKTIHWIMIFNNLNSKLTQLLGLYKCVIPCSLNRTLTLPLKINQLAYFMVSDILFPFPNAIQSLNEAIVGMVFLSSKSLAVSLLPGMVTFSDKLTVCIEENIFPQFSLRNKS